MAVRQASINDVPEIVTYCQKQKQEQGIFQESDFVTSDFHQYIQACVLSMGGTYVFVSESKEGINGILILSESRVPWNQELTLCHDLLFVASGGGPRLLALARALKEAKAYHKMYFSVSSGNDRATKFMNKTMTPVGGMYEV